MPDIKQHSPDEFLNAFREQPGNAPLALYAGAALDAAGRHEEALAVWTLGEDANSALRSAHLHRGANADLRAHSKRADQAIREHFTSLHRKTVEEFAAAKSNENLDRIRDGIWVQYAVDPFEFREPKQRPTTFYVPGLPAQPVTAGDKLSWAASIEAAYGDIVAEYETAMAAGAAQYPYVPEDEPAPYWSALRGNMDWSALYIHFDARIAKEAAHFPKTIAALESAPLVKRNGAPLGTFFSRLRPGVHIPPISGLTNSRLTVHLPICAPENCEIRVGDTLHRWKAGEIIAFDDSYEHEVWNRSDSDHAALIFETHHPDLSAAESEAIEQVYAVFDEWVRGRPGLIGLELEDAGAS